ncbi:uncharacterized protein DUF4328 [Herbihabitans rhizosphaerae]|uniref:Uncharacterized protein DUF4328 n=1 Tax=Herbihabitans rhizosphaerae TaxID=1872711 RepID=A0A4Q7L5B7_9PSEU|nr:DUF4328 domain-containing protein [Herbihabitans rhizosphaerae]RZS44497.1 uncharacterized protein DUF4328 [Herbihabitans rhizosphaerae]
MIKPVPAHSALTDRALPDLKPLGGLGDAATVLLGVATAAAGASVFGDWNAYQAVRFHLAGTVTLSDVDSADRLNAITGWISFGTIVVAAVVFVAWLLRARDIHRRRTRSLVIGACVCSVVNLCWAAWLLGQVPDETITVDTLHSIAVWSTIGLACTAAAAVLAMMIIKRITAWQEAALPRR